MTELIKVKLGMIAVMVGIVGCGFAVGGVEAAETVKDWITVLGVAATSLMTMQLGVWMINDEV